MVTAMATRNDVELRNKFEDLKKKILDAFKIALNGIRQVICSKLIIYIYIYIYIYKIMPLRN